MELKAGYKLTEVGVIPDDWSYVPLKDLFDVFSAGDLNLKLYSNFKDAVFRYPIYSNSLSNEGLYGYYKNFKYDQNSITVTARGTLGVAFYRKEKYYAIGRLLVLMSQKNINVKYFVYIINNNLKFFSENTGVPQLTVPQISKCHVPVPFCFEQNLIIDFLNPQEKLIKSLDQLITKKHDIKQATMQQLLTGQTRLPGFSGEWMNIPLKNVLTICHGKNQKKVESIDGIYPILATGGQIGLASEFMFNKPSVLIGRKGTIDKPKYMETPFWCVDTLYYSKIMDGYYPKFIYYKFLMIPWSSYNEASGVPSLNSKTIEKIEVSVPCLEEQQAIAQVLSDMDAEIEKLEEQKAKAQAIKQGMMQELLTGKTRLVEPGELVDGDAAS